MNNQFKCRITRVDTSTTSLNPIIVEFQNGSVRPDAAKHLHCGVYEHRTSKRRHVAVADGPSSYLGQEISDECCQTFLAIRNRKSNEVRFVAASKALLAPALEKVESRNPKSKNTIKENMLNLAKSFGSKIDRRRAEQIDKMQLSVDAVTDNLLASASAVVVPENELTVAEDGLIAGLPPCNIHCNTPSEIYDLSDFISVNEIAELKNEAGRLLDAGEAEIATDSNFKYSTLYRLLFSQILMLQEKESQIHKLSVLTYMEYLLQLVKTQSKALKRDDFVICPISPSVNDKLLDQFTNKMGHGWLISPEKKDTAMCHIILIGLMLSATLRLPFNVLAETLSCRPQRLIILCQAVRVTVQAAANSKVVSLSLPLPALPREATLRDYVKKKRSVGGKRGK